MKADERYNLIRYFKTNFNYEPSFFACAPGRVELLGNHTDHQCGKVLASSVNLYAKASFSLNQTNIVNIIAKGYDSIRFDLNDFSSAPLKSEYQTTSSIVRGIIHMFSKTYEIKGFDAYIESDVLVGSGLSSSAAFEILIGKILNILFADEKEDAVSLAKIGQYVENNYFGKPSGLMDQLTCSVEDIVYMDFKNKDNPEVKKIDFNFTDAGYALCIIDSLSSHENLTDEYAQIPSDMSAVANAFGKNYLSELTMEDVFSEKGEVLSNLNEMQKMRSLHYFEEVLRVEKAFEGLCKNDIKPFIKAANESGQSSLTKLQNIKEGSKYHDAFIYAKNTLNKITTEGALRINGGGFAGTLLAIVPLNVTSEFINEIQKRYPIIIL